MLLEGLNMLQQVPSRDWMTDFWDSMIEIGLDRLDQKDFARLSRVLLDLPEPPPSVRHLRSFLHYSQDRLPFLEPVDLLPVMSVVAHWRVPVSAAWGSGAALMTYHHMIHYDIDHIRLVTQTWSILLRSGTGNHWAGLFRVEGLDSLATTQILQKDGCDYQEQQQTPAREMTGVHTGVGTGRGFDRGLSSLTASEEGDVKAVAPASGPLASHTSQRGQKLVVGNDGGVEGSVTTIATSNSKKDVQALQPLLTSGSLPVSDRLSGANDRVNSVGAGGKPRCDSRLSIVEDVMVHLWDGGALHPSPFIQLPLFWMERVVHRLEELAAVSNVVWQVQGASEMNSCMWIRPAASEDQGRQWEGPTELLQTAEREREAGTWAAPQEPLSKVGNDAEAVPLDSETSLKQMDFCAALLEWLSLWAVGQYPKRAEVAHKVCQLIAACIACLPHESEQVHKLSQHLHQWAE